MKKLTAVVLYQYTTDRVMRVAQDVITFYNNYRAHSALGWRSPVTRYAGVEVRVRGLAGIPGLEPMAATPTYGPSFYDDPVTVTPRTALSSRALIVSNNS